MRFMRTKAHKIWAGKYLYGDWIIEHMPEDGHWLMFPPTDAGAIDFDTAREPTDAAQTLRDAKAMIDYWEDQEQHRKQWSDDVKKLLRL